MKYQITVTIECESIDKDIGLNPDDLALDLGRSAALGAQKIFVTERNATVKQAVIEYVNKLVIHSV